MKKIVQSLYVLSLCAPQKALLFRFNKILLLFLFMMAISLPSRAYYSTSGYAQLISLVHDFGCGGSIEYALSGNASDYTYYWKHGPTTLAITGLSPGIYTLVVRDASGCEQEFPTTVLDRSDCTAQLTFSEGPTPCEVYVTITLLDVDVHALLPGGYKAQILWSDGVTGLYTRLLSKETVVGRN